MAISRWPRASRCSTAAVAPARLSTATAPCCPISSRGFISTTGMRRLMRSTVSTRASTWAMTIRPSTRPSMARQAASTASLLAWELESRSLVLVAARKVVDAADDLGVELAEQVRQQHADGVGAAGGEALGGPVGPVVDARRRFQDPVRRLLVDQRVVVEHTGDRGDGDPGNAGDVANRGQAASPVGAPGARPRTHGRCLPGCHGRSLSGSDVNGFISCRGCQEIFDKWAGLVYGSLTSSCVGTTLAEGGDRAHDRPIGPGRTGGQPHWKRLHGPGAGRWDRPCPGRTASP